IRAGPGRVTKGAGLLLGPAHEIIFVEPCIATGHLFYSQSTLEQRFGAAALSQLCGDLDSHAGDLGFELSNIAFELFNPHQGQILWLCRLAVRFEIRFVHALLRSPLFPTGGGDYIMLSFFWPRLA